MAKRLTDKREKFVLALAAGMSQRQAYKEAYNCKSMSDRVIDNKASDLFKNGEVRVRYEELRSRIVKEAEKEAITSAKDVLAEIAGIAMDDISNYLDFRGEATKVGEDSDGNPIMGYKTIVDLKDSRTINTRNISEISIGKDGQFKFKLYPKDAALYKLAEMLGLADGEAIKIIKGDGNRQAVSKLTTEELKVLAAEIMDRRQNSRK